MKGKDILICGLAVLAGGALVGISVGAFASNKDEKADVSDTTKENLDLVDLIGDLQDEIYSIKADNTALQNQLDNVINDNTTLQNQLDNVINDNTALQNQLNDINSKNSTLENQLNDIDSKNTTLQNQVDSLFNSDVTVEGDLYSNNVVASSGDFDSITVGDTEFTKSDLDKHLYLYEIQLAVNLNSDGQNLASTFSFKTYLTDRTIFDDPINAFNAGFVTIYSLTGKDVFNTFNSGPSNFLVEAIRIKAPDKFDILKEDGEWIEINANNDGNSPLENYLYMIDTSNYKIIL